MFVWIDTGNTRFMHHFHHRAACAVSVFTSLDAILSQLRRFLPESESESVHVIYQQDKNDCIRTLRLWLAVLHINHGRLSWTYTKAVMSCETKLID